MSREAWTDLYMRMAWETCLYLTELRKFVVPHNGRMGHATTYWWWWNITNRLYWHSDRHGKMSTATYTTARSRRVLFPLSSLEFLNRAIALPTGESSPSPILWFKTRLARKWRVHCGHITTASSCQAYKNGGVYNLDSAPYSIRSGSRVEPETAMAWPRLDLIHLEA
ncbi:hypothetical protein AMTR_s00124p00061060 [Amborella trichopoda]|uniref:Uncharacterized protein n=1 Tax=Amborella trichopoda TaxID=13333 RepID=W1NRT5_AMBTC|nr:hypothetical protein AMTR_s00124p00061060 [Amborella trichopoda]